MLRISIGKQENLAEAHKDGDAHDLSGVGERRMALRNRDVDEAWAGGIGAPDKQTILSSPLPVPPSPVFIRG